MNKYSIVYKGETLSGSTSAPSSSPAQNVYSTEETVIGTWLGKPLYRKVYELKTPATASSQDTVGTIDVDMNVVGITGYLVTSEGARHIINSNYGTNVAVVVRSTNIRMIVTGSTLVSRPCWIVLEYIKTSDQEPSSSPAQNVYSTEENIRLFNDPSEPDSIFSPGISMTPSVSTQPSEIFSPTSIISEDDLYEKSDIQEESEDLSYRREVMYDSYYSRDDYSY